MAKKNETGNELKLAPETQKQLTEAEQAYNKASELVVSDQGQYDSAGEFIASLKRRKSDLEAERKKITKPMDDAKKTVMGWFAPHITKIEQAIESVNGKMVTYWREQEQKRLKAEAAAAEKARKEQERLQKRAAAAEEKGKTEKADILRQQSELVNTSPVAPATSKQTANTTMVTTWSAKVVDKLTLIQAVAAGKASMECLEPNMTVLNQMARAQKETLNIPGVKAVSETGVRTK